MNIFKKILKLFELPSPVDMGRSKYNSLPMRTFDPFDKSYCWEDYDKEAKEKYPFRFFLNKTIPHHFAVRVSIPFDNFKWWLIDLFRKPHLLDMRCEEYTGGYIDPCQAMLYANFNLLDKYIDSKPYNLRENYSEEEIDNNGLRSQQNFYDEAFRLYQYWHIERQAIKDRNHLLYLAMKEAAAADDIVEYNLLKKQWLHGYDLFDEKEQQALEDLVKIRPGLFT